MSNLGNKAAENCKSEWLETLIQISFDYEKIKEIML